MKNYLISFGKTRSIMREVPPPPLSSHAMSQMWERTVTMIEINWTVTMTCKTRAKGKVKTIHGLVVMGVGRWEIFTRDGYVTFQQTETRHLSRMVLRKKIQR
jgi:hypothetical protein